MFCPTCQTVMRVDGALCPACGDAIHPILATDVVEAVEGSAAYAEGAAPSGNGDPAITIAEAADTALVTQEKKQMSLLTRIPELSLRAWQQPAVRTAVRTGAGAIALSLALRVARQWLLEPRRQAAVVDSLVPTLGELLRPAEAVQRRSPRRGVEVSETIVYVRRTIRQ